MYRCYECNNPMPAVWVVCNKGQEKPIGIFSDKEAAEYFMNVCKTTYHNQILTMFEMVIDAP